MTHTHYRELLNRQLDDALTRAERAQLDTHLADCADCARYAADLRTLDARLTQSLPARWGESPVSAGSLDPTVASPVPDLPVRRPQPTVGSNALAFGGVLAAVAMLVVAVGLGLLLRGGESQPGTANGIETTSTPTAASTTSAQARGTPTAIRSGPGAEWAIIAEVDAGQALTVTGRTLQGDWMRVDWGAGDGWVATSQLILPGDVTVIPEVEAPRLPTTDSPLPTPTLFPGTLLPPDDEAIVLEGITVADPTLLYRQPLPDGDTVIAFDPGQPVTAVARTQDAAWVLVDEGGGGWVAASDLDLQGDVTTLEVSLSSTDQEPIPPTPTPLTCFVTAADIDNLDPAVYGLPYTSASIIAEANGESLPAVALAAVDGETWFEIRWLDGRAGWVRPTGWQIVGCDALPATSPPPPPPPAAGTPTPISTPTPALTALPTPTPSLRTTPQVDRPPSDALTHRFTVNATNGYEVSHTISFEAGEDRHLIEVYVGEPPGALAAWTLNLRVVCESDSLRWQDWITGAQAPCGTPGAFDKTASLGNAYYFVVGGSDASYTLELSITP